jgi:hypothetical protein
MKRRGMFALTLLSVIVLLILVGRRGRLVGAEREPQATLRGSSGHVPGPATEPRAPVLRSGSPVGAGEYDPRRAFGPGALAKMIGAADAEANLAHAVERSRDLFYERLLLKQGRDHAEEERVQRQLMAAFGDDPDTLVGGVVCSPDFCRLELRGVGKIDVRERWQPPLTTAVNPKGLKFFVIARDDDDNTITSYYFGRDESWSVPDFATLGLLETPPARY